MTTTWMFSPRSEGSNITQKRGKQDDVSSRCHRDKCAEERGRMYTCWGGGTTVCVCVCVCVCVGFLLYTRMDTAGRVTGSATPVASYLDHKVTD